MGSLSSLSALPLALLMSLALLELIANSNTVVEAVPREKVRVIDFEKIKREGTFEFVL